MGFDEAPTTAAASRPAEPPWRDGRAVVLNPQLDALPRICVVTGRSMAGERTWLPASIDHQPLLKAAVLIAIAMFACIALLESGAAAWVAIGVVFLLAYPARRLLRTWLERGKQIGVLGYAVAEVVPPTVLQRLVYFACGPLLLAFSLVALFSIQFKHAASLDRQPLVAGTMIWLAVLVAALAYCFVGFMGLRPRPLRARLRTTRRYGRLAWVEGVHPALLVQLPEYPGDDAYVAHYAKRGSGSDPSVSTKKRSSLRDL